MTSSEERRRTIFQGFYEITFQSSICGSHVNQTEILISVPQVKVGTLHSVLRIHARELCFGYSVFPRVCFLFTKKFETKC